MVENSAYGVHVQGSAGDRLEPDYNMENNPLYEMRILSNEGHSHKTQTPAPVPVYETVDNAITCFLIHTFVHNMHCVLKTSSQNIGARADQTSGRRHCI